jgi:hypothetical protein
MISFIDERFLEHRRRSTSTAGIAIAAASILLWYYHYLFDHVLRWELFGLGVGFVVIKFALMAWYRFKD